MAGTSDIEVIKTICSVIDESQDKVLQTTQSIKAQIHLTKKLKQKAKRNKERCNYILDANLKLQSEITQAKQSITSLLVAQDTIKKANVELKKELLLAKEKKVEVTETMKQEEKKYEDLWLESKARYESLPFVQKLLKAKEEVKDLKQQISELNNEEKMIYEEMKIKKEACREIDRKRTIQLAEFMVIDMPKSINLIKEKSAAIDEIVEELNRLGLKTDDNVTKNDLKADNDCTSIMPKLQLNYFDFDKLNANLEKIKADEPFLKDEATSSVHSIILVDPTKLNKKKTSDTEDYISSFFFKPKETQNYAKKKLINILEDIKINNIEAQRLVADVKSDLLQPVDSISVDNHQNIADNNGSTKDNISENEDIEVIDLTASGAEVVAPPTQFLDMTTEMQVDGERESQKVSEREHRTEELHQAPTSTEMSYQEENCKKVKFDLPNAAEPEAINDTEQPENEGEMDANETINSQSSLHDEKFESIKEMLMKKHNLDLSPQFVYTKNVMAPLNLQKPEDAVVTSKFFPQEQNQQNTEVEPPVAENIAMDIATEVDAPMEVGGEPVKPTVHDNLPIEGVSDAKKQKITELTQVEKPISGFLFGSQMTSEFLDESTNSTEFGDDYIPSCLDTSLLQSPKANLSLTNMESQEVLSQDVPNFLAGLRKTGFSFFGCSSSESKPDPSGQNKSQGESGFSFNFGGEEKKSRGGLFSLFQ